MKPAPLFPPATIGVIAPASAPSDEVEVRRGIEQLRRLGFDVRSRRPHRPYGYLCGPDAARLAELNEALRHPNLDALFCVRGGYGTLRLLPYLDYEAARAHPKLLVGYSDITALQWALYHRAGWPSLSGPMVGVEWPTPDAASMAAFWALAQGAMPAPLLGPHGEALQPVRPGTAEGVLLGGNLTLITRLIGTPFAPPLDGAILYLEEVGEPPYKIDGLLAHLRLAGILDRLGGLILGQFTEAEPLPDRPSCTLEDVLRDYTADLPCPVARGLVYGHIPVKNTLPIGVRARLVVEGATAALHLLEPVVAGNPSDSPDFPHVY